MALPKNRVIRLRNDPMEMFRSLAITIFGLVAVVGGVMAAIYFHGDAIDTNFESESAQAGSSDAPSAQLVPSGQPAPDAPGLGSEAAVPDPVDDLNLTAPAP